MKPYRLYVLVAAFYTMTCFVPTSQAQLAKSAKSQTPSPTASQLRQSRGQALAVQSSAKARFNIRRLEEQAKTLKRIESERSLNQRIQQVRSQHAQARRVQKASNPQLARKAKMLGHATRFVQAPPMSPHVIPARLSAASSSNFLIDGKTQDTVSVGDAITATFSFAPNAVSAVADIYYDADGDGSVDPSDVQLFHLLLVDNDDNDENAATGQYQFRIEEGDWLTRFAGSFVLVLNDYQSVSTATVVVRQKPTNSVVLVTTSPSMPGLLWYVNGVPGSMYVFSDSAGNFSFYVDRHQVGAVTLYEEYDFNGVSNGYIPLLSQTIYISSDTTNVVLSFKPATSFVEGYVKDQTGDPVFDATVEADGPSFLTLTHTDSSGYYKAGVSPGTCYLYADVSWNADYLQSYNSPYVIVPANATVQSNIQLIRSNNTISGNVTLGSQGVGGISIYAYTDSLYNTVLTSVGGRYSLPVYASPSGTLKYTVFASIPNGFYFPSPSWSNVSPGAANVDFAASRVPGGIKGRITDWNTGLPIPNAEIYASGQDYKSTFSNDSGYYRMSLLDGVYSVTFDASGYHEYSQSNIYIASSIYTLNVALRKSGTISGTVKDVDGNPVPSADVEVMDTSGYYVGYGYTDLEGKYIVSGLTTSSYKVQCWMYGYVNTWYNNTTNWYSATPVHVTDGFDTPNIDFVLSRGGSISGKVTDKSGSPIPDLEIDAYDTSLSWQSYAMTDDSGNYAVSGLITGKYYLETYSPIYIDQWYDGADSPFNAKSVSVTIDQNTPHVDFVLSRGASISGEVKTKANVPIPYAYIYVVDSLNSLIGYTSTNDTGSYVVNKLNPGKRLYVYAGASGYSTKWYNNVSTPDSATAIILQDEETRSNIDFVLPLPGQISGRILDNSGAPVAYAYVDVLDTQGNYVGYGYSDYDGTYLVNYLSAGRYFALAYSYNYWEQWFDHKATLSQADTITVIDEQVTSNINFDLHSYVGARDTVSIVEARRDDNGDLIPDYAITGDTIAISGVVTTPNFVASNNETSYYIQDLTGGIDLFSYGPIGTGLSIGDSILVVGTVQFYRGSTEIIPPEFDPAHFRILKHGARVPAPRKLTLQQFLANPEMYEGQLVEIDTLFKVSGTWPGTGLNSNLKLRNASKADTIVMFVDQDTDIDGSPEPQYPVNVIGIATQFSAVFTYNNGYEIMPRDTNDIAHVSGMTGIGNEVLDAPSSYALYSNYPNPFNPTTTIMFDIPKISMVTLKVFNLLGQEIMTIVSKNHAAGTYRYTFDAGRLSSGMYIYQLRASDYVETRKMILMK